MVIRALVAVGQCGVGDSSGGGSVVVMHHDIGPALRAVLARK